MFHISLLEQDSTKNGQMNKFAEMLEFNKSDDKEYEMEAISDSAVYTKKADQHLLGLYYLVT